MRLLLAHLENLFYYELTFNRHSQIRIFSMVLSVPLGFNKTVPLRYMTSGSKNPKRKASLHFDPIIRVWVLSHVVEDTFLPQSFLSSLYLFDSNFSRIQSFGLISWMLVMKELASLTVVAKKHAVLVIIVTVANR